MDDAPGWDMPVVVGGSTGRAYELRERVSDLRRDQRFRQVYPHGDGTSRFLDPVYARPGATLTWSRLHSADNVAPVRDSRDAILDSMASKDRDHQEVVEAQMQPKQRSVALPPALASLRRSLTTALTQLWPWGRGPQAQKDSAATCPAQLDGDGEDSGRQLALTHTELVKVRPDGACAVYVSKDDVLQACRRSAVLRH